jgi:hypothetical protein
MKKLIISSLIAISCFGGEVAPSKAKEFNCPNLTKINSNQEEAKGLSEGLKRVLPTLHETYSDLIKYVNKTEESEKYMSEEGIKQLGASLIYGYLIAMSVQENETKENIKKQIYESIDLKDANWCNKKIDFN